MIDIKVLDLVINAVPDFNGQQIKEPISKEVKEIVLKRDYHSCRVCGNINGIHLHHIIPNGKAGVEDMITLCKVCHRYVHLQLVKKGYKFYGGSGYGSNR